MARKLVTVLIDDRYDQSSVAIAKLEAYSEIILVGGVADAIRAMARVPREFGGVVDVVLCDINLEDDRTDLTFTLDVPEKKLEASPRFDLADLDDRSASIDPEWWASVDRPALFLPYGPLLAIPFSQYFRHGGVVRPISGYWRHPRLIAELDGGDGASPKALVNGYVQLCLALIWAQTGVLDSASPQESLPGFGEKFSSMFADAVDSSPASIIQRQFFGAVKERRQQILGRALSTQGLDRLTLQSIRRGATVVVWNQDQTCVEYDAKSLFADYDDLHSGFSLEASITGESRTKALRRDLSAEIKKVSTPLNIPALLAFCREFTRISDAAVDITFAQLYARARATLDIGAQLAIPQVVEVRYAPPVVRRYLSLFAQLSLISTLARRGRRGAGDHRGLVALVDEELRDKPAVVGEMCKALGIAQGKDTTNRLKEFVLGNRDPVQAKRLYGDNKFARAFRTGQHVGWHAFNIVNPRAQKASQGKRVAISTAEWDWQPLDRWMAQQFWPEWGGKDGLALPHGLGEPT